MKIVKFADIRDEFIGNLRRDMIIPVIGSGFTCGCNSHRGHVPSGDEYKAYMMDEIRTRLVSLSEKEKDSLSESTFSEISSLYHRVIPLDKRRDYLRDNFSQVTIEKYKHQFLQIAWPYIYTLNIDDGIERTKTFDWLINANRPVYGDVFDKYRCVIKLHGDVAEMINYKNPQSEIFSQEQYLASLKKNDSLLSKLHHDSLYQNLLYVGCSLRDEIDLLAYNPQVEASDNVTAKYLCLIEKPGVLDGYRYEQHGITHIILFDTYRAIYEDIYEAWLESQKIRVDDLEAFKISHSGSNRLSHDFGDNKPYLLFGKSLIKKRQVPCATLLFYIEDSDRLHNKRYNYASNTNRDWRWL